MLEAADFEALILEIPEKDLEDKLTQLTGEKGQITKSLYEDFIIAICVANVNQLLAHLNQKMVEPKELLKIRDELVGAILDVNPLLAPDKLVINRNYVVKIKRGRRKKDEKLLTDLETWNISYYDDLANVSQQIDEKIKGLDAEAGKKKGSGDDEDLKNIEELEFGVIKKWWPRLSQYIEVKKYSSSDVESILKQRFFHNRSSFETYIVSVCVNEFEDLFNMLDDLGIPKSVAPPIIMHELYEICKAVNEFLTFEKAQELASGGLEDDEDASCENPFAKAFTKSGPKSAKKAKDTRTFKDVPKEDVLRLGDNMRVFLIGQDEAIDTVADSIQRASVGLKDPNKPLGSFLFAGRTGVGKTLASKVLADELIKGSKDNLITVDCSEYTADHEYSKLIGAPAGYVGHESGGMLTNALQKNPFSVVVFDEIEKASFKVHQLLLQILEEGRLTDGKGKVVSFRDAVVIMTSNVGVAEIQAIGKTIGFGDAAKITDKKKDTALNEALKKKFKPEFLNRIDAIVNFKNLTEKDYMKIIDIELYKLGDNMKNNDSPFKEITLEFDDKLRKHVYKNGINEEYGARPLKRFIEREVATPLARKLLSNEADKDTVVKVSVEKDEIVFQLEKKPADKPFYMSNGYGEMVSNVLGDKK
jgi:hypothetical protein